MRTIAVELGVAYLSLTAETKDFAKAAKKALGDLEQESGKTGKSSGSKLGAGIVTGMKVAGGAIAGVAALVGGLAIKGGISRALAIEDAQAKLKGLGHTTESITAIMGSALDSVRGTAFGLGDAAGVAATVVAAGVQPGEDLTRTLKLVADASTIAGTSMGDMGAIFNKVASTGKIQGEVIAQLGERGIPILALLADELGVTAGEVADLASKGKIDFATFQNAMEAGMGGAALASGDTFRGAMANAMAALGRLGEKVVSGVLPQIKTGFGDAITILDSWAPHAEAAGVAIGQALSSSVEWIRGTLIPAIRDTVTWLRENAATVKIVAGVVGAALLPVLLSTVAAWIRAEVAAIRSAAAQFASHYKVVAGWVMSAAAAVRSGAQTVAVWAMYRIEAAKSAAATVAAHGRMAAAWVASKVQAVSSAAASTAAWVAASARTVAATVAQSAALVASRAVMVAGAAATGIATAAQWAWNAALAANPIGLVVVAIAALVAGLVWFFTQTEAGQKVVQAVWGAIQTAISAVVEWVTGTAVPWITGAWDAISGAAQALWAKVTGAWDAIVSGVKAALAVIQAVWSAAWGAVSAVASAVWSAITSVITARVNAARSVVTSVVGAIRTAVSSAFNVLGGIVSSAWNAVYNAISGPINRAYQTVSSVVGQIKAVFSGASSWLIDAGKSIIQGLIDGISSKIRAVTDTLKGLTASIPDWKGPADVDRRLLVGNGQLIMGGLIKGLQSGYGDVRRELQGMTADLPTAVSVNSNLEPRTANQGPAVVQHIHPRPEMSEQAIGAAAARTIGWEMAGVRL